MSAGPAILPGRPTEWDPMYRTCIYCSADLGSNDALEPFPVGRSIAFDGSAEDFLLRTAAESRPLGKRQDMPGRQLRPEGSLALEMALHEEQERRALEGELALLDAAWREAEEIAAIADRLAGEVPARPELATG